MSDLREMFVDELRDLYDAEKQLTKAIPKMAKAASNPELKQGFTEHLEQTKLQVARLEKCFELLGERARSKPCSGMKGIVEEGKEQMQEDLSDALMDAALNGAAKRVEHYEMAGYQAAVEMAKALKETEVVPLLQQTLDEETQMDRRLSQLGKTLLKTALAEGEEEEEAAPARASAAKSAKSKARGNSGSSKQARGSSKVSKSARSGGQPLSQTPVDDEEIT
ncbi:MAG TPA: ferritin-like domain-containing protein [Solibacterales bacterium]|nr:ferritin-like domain-containing protein [Bryobacterales bacterium]